MGTRQGLCSVKTPVRIYVLWHADYEDGMSLARQIYHWFRLSTGEGIPVYFRSWRSSPAENPEIRSEDCDLNIVVPLVEPHMVASVPWRWYIENLTAASLDSGEPLQEAPAQETGSKTADIKMLPVALDVTAYQMPPAVKRLNFIRHLATATGATDDGLLTKLTEAMCLLLRESITGPTATPIKIFLSHAKSDGTDVPKQIKHFIQTETQCHTFFDENDINYGRDFEYVIKNALQTESAGLLVIQGDHYADRPWCRKEIRDFLMPHRVETEDQGEGRLYAVMPAVVVTNFAGTKTARTIPELGHASCLQWTEAAARRAVVTVLREILFSSFYRLLARAAKRGLTSNRAVNLMVNRPPDPVMIEHVCRDAGVSRDTGVDVVIHHPGHGLSGVERKGLDAIYREKVKFQAFGASRDAEECRGLLPGREWGQNPFAGEVLSVSVSESSDVLTAGIGNDHTVELLRNILRPAFKQGISLLYGGSLPVWAHRGPPWKTHVNFTETFIDYLLAERNAEDSPPDRSGSRLDSGNQQDDAEAARPAPRLFNLSAWPYSAQFGVQEEAQWINTCSFIRVTQEDAGVAEVVERPAEEGQAISPQQRLNTVLCLTAMRKKACGEIRCEIPDLRSGSAGRRREDHVPPEFEFAFTPLAHLFIGGKLTGFSGAIPGVWEEILEALEAGRPCFIVGAARGATGMIARWLMDPPQEKPAELYFGFFEDHASDPDLLRRLVQGIEQHDAELAPQKRLDRLWQHVSAGLPDNGLTDSENRVLWGSSDFREIAHLIGKGLCALKTRQAESA